MLASSPGWEKPHPRVMVGLDDAVLEAPPLPDGAVMRHARPVTLSLFFSCSGAGVRMRIAHSHSKGCSVEHEGP